MIQPFGDNLLIKPVEEGGILQSMEGSLCQYGEVVAIGDKVQHIKVGDKIGFTIWGVNKLKIENEKYYFIPEDSRFVLGILLS